MPSFYAIIPANIRYDKALTPNAKLLYGEITALCNEKGYCWATNAYFAELYQVSTKSISLWIKSLVDKGYLHSRIKYKPGTKEVETRIISIATPPEEILPTPMEDNFQPPGRKLPDPPEEKVKENTTVNNTKNNKESANEIILPFKGEGFKKTWDEWLEYRKKRKLPKYAKPEHFFKQLQTLSQNEESAAVGILEQSMANNWQGVFPLKNIAVTSITQKHHEKTKHELELEQKRKDFKPVLDDYYI